MSRERLKTQESVALATTVCRTGHVTQPLVVMLWTLGPAVTHVVSKDTHSGISTTVQTRTCPALSVSFVFLEDTVKESVTSCVDREAVEPLLGAAIVGTWQRFCEVPSLKLEVASTVKVE